MDFLGQAPETGVSAIITNPPYALAREFIERALHFDDTRIVAMLLGTDFDHAARRAHLFADCVMFAKKVVLTERIRWFEDSNGSPSFNHCWMIWDRQHRGPPTLAYAMTTSRAQKSALTRIADSVGTSQDVADVPSPDIGHDCSGPSSSRAKVVPKSTLRFLSSATPGTYSTASTTGAMQVRKESLVKASRQFKSSSV